MPHDFTHYLISVFCVSVSTITENLTRLNFLKLWEEVVYVQKKNPLHALILDPSHLKQLNVTLALAEDQLSECPSSLLLQLQQNCLCCLGILCQSA